MDYNDNDYEGHNLQLTGEESSKISSVLRPFALPKFEFDDSLQGHLRFDSLVENEVFLGIPSQEDSQWIEDFSRGGSGIAFSSSAAESCALPRHINVWSEATSSESVEMLLKAVGQEEMVSGEKLTEASEPGDQLGSSTRQMESNGRQDAKSDDGIDYGNSSLPSAEVTGNISRSNQSAGAEVIQAEDALQAGETNVSIYGVCTDGDDESLTENSENYKVELKRITDNKVETCGLVNEYLSIHVQENMPILGAKIGIEKTESPSQNVSVSVTESLDQGKISDIGFACPSFVIEAISPSVVEHEEGCKKILGGNAIETHGTELHCTHEIPSEMESSEEEHSVEMCVGNLTEESNVPRIGESVSTRDGDNVDAFVVEPSGGSQPITEIFSSGTEINQLSEGHIILHENSSVYLKGEGAVELEVEDSDVVIPTIRANTEINQLSEGHSIVNDNSSISLNGDGVVGREVEDSDVVIPTICGNIEINQLSEGLSILRENSSVSLKGEGVMGREGEDSDVVIPTICGNTEINQLSEGLSILRENSSVSLEEESAVGLEGEDSDVVIPTICGNAEINQLSEGRSMLRDNSSVSLKGEGVMGLEVEDSDVLIPTIHGNPEINQLSEGQSILHENSSVSLKGEGVVGLEVEDIDVVIPTICGNTELKQVPDNQPSHQNNSPIRSEDFHPGSHNSFDSPHASFELHCNPSDKVCETNHADDPDTAAVSTFDGEPCGKLSMIDGMTDAGYVATVQKENIKDGNEFALPLVAGNIHTTTVDIIPMQLDDREDDLNVTVHERDAKQLPPDLSDLICDGNENKLSSYSGEGVQVDTTTGSQPNSVARDSLSLNTDELVDGKEYNSPSCDMAFRDQSEETESQDPKQPLSSVSKEILELKEPTPVFETEKGPLPNFEAGKTQTSSQSVVFVETSITAMSYEDHKELKMDNSSNDLIVQNGGVEATHTEKPMGAAVGIKSGSNSSIVSVTSCAVEMDKSNQDAPPEISRDLLQHVIDNQTSFKRGDVENIAEVPTTSMIAGVNASSKEAEPFSFEITPLGRHSTGDSGRGPLSFPRIQACKLALTGEGSPLTSGSSQRNPVEVKEVSHVFPSLTSPSGSARGPSVRKVRRAGSKSGKASSYKGDQVKETTPLRQTEWEKPSQFLSPSVAGELVTFESIAKSRGSVSIPTSSLPDLNTSATSSVFFQQPFTDLQQVQLRAQIFVYGSLIQGAVPDEACMVSAFDGGRSFWAPSWRACVDRLHGQKSQGTNTETPVSLRSGTKAPDQTQRQGFPQSNKAIPSPVVNPMISLSSPLWNTSFPSTEALPPSSIGRNAVIDYQAVSPLNSFQTPSIRNYVPHTTWPSQAPFPVPWLTPSQTSAYDISTNPAFPILVDPLKLTPSKESSLAAPSSTKHASPIPTSHIVTSTTFAGASSLDLKMLNVSTGQPADTKKTRRKKKSSGAEDAVHVSMTTALLDTVSDPVVASQLSNKGPAVEDLSQNSFIARNNGDRMSTPVVSSHYSTLVAVATPSSFVQENTANQFFSMVSSSITSDQFKRDDLSFDKMALNNECVSKVEEAKFQAQEAATHAAAAISQCEGVWSQLVQQKNSGLTLDAQSKLSSAAVAIAAAASVAKAAAMAANIASTAALQAKQMADEALTMSETVDPTGHNGILVSNSMNLVNATPESILQGGEQNNAPSLAISAAREASKKRIEAASAATRHAENLGAIVKAAELAAEAVSHAGKIVAMGEPFSLSELAEASPNSYWKVLKVGDNKNKDKYITSNSGEVPKVQMNQHKISDKDMDITSELVPPIMASGKHEENFKPHKDTNVSDSANTVVSDPDIKSRSMPYTLSSLKEGSYVEVLKHRDDIKNAWFSANVLRLKDAEALVSYTDLQSDEGSEQLKEWISIEAKDSDAPKIRVPHQMTALQIEGTRKRLRAAIKDYTWSVGDKVDAWVQDCWREGIIAETNKNEVTTLSVHFPAQGETLLVNTWHLRPTLIWSDGQWIEWCGPGQDRDSQGDTPVEKRPKLTGSGSIEAKGKAKVANNMDFVEMGRNEVPRLPLSANEKTFSIVSSMREENKPNMVRTMSSGVEKERSRVVFGVPKPGKKRKFMEVSKHYVSNRDAKTSVPSNDSMKSAKLLAPQGSGSQGFKNKSKELQVVESRPRAIKSGKPPSIPSRNLARNDDSTSSRPNAAISNTGKGSISNDENESGEQNLSGSGSFSNVEEATSGGSMVFSSEALPLDNRKKTATRNVKSGRLNQGKRVPSSGKSAKHEANEKLISEASEPRRSIRRIQPTSRLLEGLQSSLLISKIPSSSHGKKPLDSQQRRNQREQ